MPSLDMLELTQGISGDKSPCVQAFIPACDSAQTCPQSQTACQGLPTVSHSKRLLCYPPAWGCLDLTCYTDYLWTVTCVLETWNLHPSTLTLTW